MNDFTKEGFWNPLSEKYPNSMKLFFNWIDNYKEENNWGDIFNEGDSNGDDGCYRESPKYHELPMAMQVGIFLEFVEDTCNKYQLSFLFDGFVNIKYRISDYLKRLQNQRLDV